MADGDFQDKTAPIWLARGADIYNLIKSVSTRKNIPAGTVLTSQGDNVPYIHFVLKGRAQAFIYSRAGQHFWVADFGPGDLFGHPEILSDKPIEFEVQADTDMQIAVLPAKKFKDMMLEATQLGENISTDLSISLSRAHTRLFELANFTAKARVYAELLRMAKPIGKMPDTWIIRPHPIYTNFALRVYSTRETVSRTINELKQKGIVARETGALVILKPESLRQRLD